MSTSPSNLKLALDAYDAQQRRQAALLEAERIGTLIHIQEQQLLAAKQLAKQRKSQRRRHSSHSAPTATTTPNATECAIEDDEEDVEQSNSGMKIFSLFLLYPPLTFLSSAPTPIPASLAARRAARSAAKRTSSLPVLESIPEPEHDEQVEPELTNNSLERFALHKRRPQEPYAALASRSQWKVSF